VGLANDLLKEFEYQLEGLALVPSDGGKFEVKVGERLIYSKLQTHRHAEPGEVVGLVRKIINNE
jgi:selenoprotein W-related protein